MYIYILRLNVLFAIQNTVLNNNEEHITVSTLPDEGGLKWPPVAWL